MGKDEEVAPGVFARLWNEPSCRWWPDGDARHRVRQTFCTFEGADGLLVPIPPGTPLAGDSGHPSVILVGWVDADTKQQVFIHRGVGGKCAFCGEALPQGFAPCPKAVV